MLQNVLWSTYADLALNGVLKAFSPNKCKSLPSSSGTSCFAHAKAISLSSQNADHSADSLESGGLHIGLVTVSRDEPRNQPQQQ